jgi:hypothetical protein
MSRGGWESKCSILTHGSALGDYFLHPSNKVCEKNPVLFIRAGKVKGDNRATIDGPVP